MITTMKESNVKLEVTRPSEMPRVMMAKTRLKPPSTSFATLNGLLSLKGSTLGSSTGWNCCWPGCWFVEWAGMLKRAATGFSGMVCAGAGAAAWLLDGWLAMMGRESSR